MPVSLCRCPSDHLRGQPLKPCINPEITYVGCVLDKFEENGPDDSDFLAVVWDDENQRVTSTFVSSTRSWTYHNHAEVDMTPDVEEKALAWYRAQYEQFTIKSTRRDAAIPQMGDRVRSTTTKGKNKGLEGTIGWICNDSYSYEARHPRLGLRIPQRYGIDPDDQSERVFLSEGKVEMIDPRPVDEASIRAFAKVARPSNWQSALTMPLLLARV